jgi:hypothetical protein
MLTVLTVDRLTVGKNRESKLPQFDGGERSILLAFDWSLFTLFFILIDRSI